MFCRFFVDAQASLEQTINNFNKKKKTAQSNTLHRIKKLALAGQESSKFELIFMFMLFLFYLFLLGSTKFNRNDVNSFCFWKFEKERDRVKCKYL